MSTLNVAAVGSVVLFLFGVVTSSAQGLPQGMRSPLVTHPALAASQEVEEGEWAENEAESFSGTGVLMFFVQNGATNVWLIYETKNAVVKTQPLLFSTGNSISKLKNTYGATHVRIEGAVVQEEVAVRTIAPAQEEDSPIALVQTALNESVSALGVTLTPRLIVQRDITLLARVEVTYRGITENVFFQQGTLVQVGKHRIALTRASSGKVFFAIALSK